MIDPPKPRTIQHAVLQVFLEHSNEDIRREEIIDKAGILVGGHLWPQQVDSAIQGLRNRGYRIFPTSPIVYGDIWSRTFKLFTNENEEPPVFERKHWVVVVPCNDESEAHRLAKTLKQVLKVEIEVKQD